MKKLAFLMVLVMALGVGSVIGEDQDVDAQVADVIEITVNNIDFGTVTPGQDSSEGTSTVTAGTNNNVDLTVTVSVSNPGTPDLFSHLVFDTDLDADLSGESEIGVSSFDVDVDDDSFKNILVKLAVPEGFAPGGVSGIVQYLAAKRVG